MNVSIIVPAYNEEHGLGGVLTQLSAALSFSRLVFVTFYIAGGLIGALAWWIKPAPLNVRINRRDAEDAEIL